MKRYLEDTPNHTFWFPSLGIPPLSTPYNHPKGLIIRYIIMCDFCRWWFLGWVYRGIFYIYHSKNYILSHFQLPPLKTVFCHSKYKNLSLQTVTPSVTPKGQSSLWGTKKETISLPYKNNCRMVIFFRSNAILIYSPTLPSYSLK